MRFQKYILRTFLFLCFLFYSLIDVTRLEQFMGFFPASAFAPGFDLKGNADVPAAMPQIPQLASELTDYSYPAMSLQSAQQPFGFPDMTKTNPYPTAPMQSFGVFGDPNEMFSLPVESKTTPETPSSGGDDFMSELIPTIGTPGDQEWWAFLADSGLPVNPPR